MRSFKNKNFAKAKGVSPLVLAITIGLALFLALIILVVQPSSQGAMLTSVNTPTNMLPDLVVANFGGDWGPPGTACSSVGARRGVLVIIRNQGSADAKDFVVQLGTDLPIATQVVHVLEPDQTLKLWFENNFSRDALIPLEVFIDPQQHIQELNKTNNRLYQEIYRGTACPPLTATP